MKVGRQPYTPIHRSSNREFPCLWPTCPDRMDLLKVQDRRQTGIGVGHFQVYMSKSVKVVWQEEANGASIKRGGQGLART